MIKSDPLHYEKKAWNNQYKSIAGIDEAGRGPLAGPVVAAAVIFKKEYILNTYKSTYLNLTDSKKLSKKNRNLFYKILKNEKDVNIGIGISSAKEIDKINILQATHKAMHNAVKNLSTDFILVDGLPVSGFFCNSENIINGDLLSLSISAASVIAKVTRDRIMNEESIKFPMYNFDKNKGYGTKEHLSALIKFGPSPIHRKSFKPICNY